MQICLSRKGFDSTYGNAASIIYENRFISIPIPEVCSGIKYDELILPNGDSYLKMMTDLNILKYTECHLDPDLIRNVIPNRNKWLPAFGQSGKSLSFLRSNITDDVLFLFYGWFRKAIKIKNKYEYQKNSKNIHAIWGYLKSGKPYTPVEFIKQFPDINHPHIKQSNYENLNYFSSDTAIFVGQEGEYLGKNTYGTFYYDDSLVLTDNSQENRSVWLLPDYFKDVTFNGKTNLIPNPGNKIQIEFIGRNLQELFLSEDKNIINWAENLINSNQIFA